MDVNGTRLHLLLGQRDWEDAVVPPADPDVCFDVGRSTIGLRPQPFVFPTRPEATRLLPSDRRGADVDRHGNHFWVSDDRTSILAAGPKGEHFEWWSATTDPTDPTGPTDFDGLASGFVPCEVVDLGHVELGGLAVTVDHYLVVGAVGVSTDAADQQTAWLLVFDLAGGGLPVLHHWPDELGVSPFDLTAMPEGGVTVLDIADPSSPGIGRLWHLDRTMQLVSGAAAPDDVPAAFAPVDEAVPVEPPSTLSRRLLTATADDATVIDATWPIAVEALADGSVLVLDRLGSALRPELTRWRCGEQLPFELAVADDGAADVGFVCSDQQVNAGDVLAGMLGHDITVVCDVAGVDAGVERVFMVDDAGDQAFEFVLDEEREHAELATRFHPLRLFSGKAVVSSGATAMYDLEERFYPIPTQPVERYATDAVIVLAPVADGGRGFDAKVPGTVWHRLAVDASVPPGTSLTVESRAADDLDVLAGQPWLPEPGPYLRHAGSEVPYHVYDTGRDCAGQGTWELLFQRAVGRYLQLRVTLQGDRRRTVRIWSVRVHAPRFSYLSEYLPAIYREDRESASFLDRYLANVEGMFTTLEGQVANVRRLVDPTTIDADYLPWLAAWVGAVVEPDWETARQRLLVRHAAQLFTRRGTQRGLIEAIRLATHPCPTDAIFEPGAGDAFDVRIVESFRTRSVAGVVFGDPNDLAGPGYVSTDGAWELSDGRAQLERRWQDFLEARHGTGATPAVFPTTTPLTPAAADDWHGFVRGELTVTYPDIGSADTVFFRQFLAQRYPRFDDYLAAWNLTGALAPADYSTVGLPSKLPADGAPLEDWIVFVSSVVGIRRAAHRATVLVPIRFEDSDEVREQRLGRVRRVIDVQRPAHTLVDVAPYWAACRVGEARVGLETIVGAGSRYVDMVLGVDRLAHAITPGGATWRLDDRVVVGRDRIERSVEPAGTGGS